MFLLQVMSLHGAVMVFANDRSHAKHNPDTRINEDNMAGFISLPQLLRVSLSKQGCQKTSAESGKHEEKPSPKPNGPKGDTGATLIGGMEDL